MAEMDVALTSAFKSVALSRIQDAPVFVGHVATEVAAAEASPAREITSKRRKCP